MAELGYNIVHIIHQVEMTVSKYNPRMEVQILNGEIYEQMRNRELPCTYVYSNGWKRGLICGKPCKDHPMCNPHWRQYNNAWETTRNWNH